MKRTAKPQRFISRAEKRIATGKRNGNPRRGHDGRIKGSNNFAGGGLRVAGGSPIDWDKHAENLAARKQVREEATRRKEMKKMGEDY